jgi:mRNA-degrading endonuclease RelE of RelBE toxin-antitoxin system
MAYAVILRRSAEKELDRFPDKVRIRVGDYRVLYLIDDKADDLPPLAGPVTS